MRERFSKWLVIVLLAQAAVPANAAEKKEDLCLSGVSFGYWNDNMDYEEYFEGLKYGLDDYMTSSFQLKGFFNRGWEAEVLLNVITNRAGGYRTDLLTGRVYRTYTGSSGRWKIGAGIAGLGDFGGSKIQNGYHRSRGILEVDLPYAYSTVQGICMGADYFYNCLEYKKVHVKLFGGGYICTGIGLGSFRGGGVVNLSNLRLSSFSFRPAMMVYHRTYSASCGSLEPIFRSGLSCGGQICVTLTNKIGFSLWTVSNMYRNDQGQIGVTFYFGRGIEGRDDYGMMMYP